MREIKFRYKGTDGEWVYKSLLDHIYNVDQNTVCQYTGLKDINGKEIYEFDVLKTAFSSKPFGVVTWNENGGYFFIDTSVIPIQWNNSYRPLGEMIDIKIGEKPVNIEVIGNIYDNPNLFVKEKISSINGYTLLPISDCPEEILRLLYSKRIKYEDGLDEPFETYKDRYRVVMVDSTLYCATNDRRREVVSRIIESDTIDKSELIRYADAVIKENNVIKNRFGNK